MLNNLRTEIHRISHYSDKHLTKIVKQGGDIFTEMVSNRDFIKGASKGVSKKAIKGWSKKASNGASKKALKRTSNGRSKKSSNGGGKKNMSGGSQILSVIDNVIDNNLYISVLFIILYLLYYFIPKPKPVCEVDTDDRIKILNKLNENINFNTKLSNFLNKLNDKLLTFSELNLTNIYRNQINKYRKSDGTNSTRTGSVIDMGSTHEQPSMGANMNYNVWFALDKRNSDAYNGPGRRTITFEIIDNNPYHYLLYLHKTKGKHSSGRTEMDREFITELNNYMFTVNNAIKNSLSASNRVEIKTILKAFGLNVPNISDITFKDAFKDALKNRELLEQKNLDEWNNAYCGYPAGRAERNSEYDGDRRWTEYLCDFFNSLIIILNFLPDAATLKNELLPKITSTVGYFHYDTFSNSNQNIFAGELTISQYNQSSIIKDINARLTRSGHAFGR
jgi:hypothetical protein